MSLFTVSDLSHAFGDNILYQNAAFSLEKGEHTGVVGANGAGKSTLLKIISGEVIPDSGAVDFQSRLKVGCLDQYAALPKDLTARAFLRTAFSDLAAMEQEMLALYEHAGEEELSRAAELQSALDAADYYNAETRMEQVAAGLGIREIGMERKISEMSGGQRAKLILAKLLLEQPDVLLLDEPTNFLDKSHIAWLADWLSGISASFLLVSHDRAFLEKTVNRILDLDGRNITKYYSDYKGYLKKKEFLTEQYARDFAAQQKEIEKLEAFVSKNRAGTKSRQARSRQNQLNRMERLVAPEDTQWRPRVRFAALPVTASTALETEFLAVGYDDVLLQGLNLRILGGEKVVLTGFNGVGKTTLIKTLLGELPAKEGAFRFALQTAMGYVPQDVDRWENPLTPIQILSAAFPALTEKAARSALAQCGISRRHAVQAVGTLSGGEQMKLSLCLLMQRPANFLILDEPTNHLDALAKEALQKAIADFPGTVLLVSHEEAFYAPFAQRVISVDR